ncbi:WhiB family redox-sensing transcriptional regulator [Actinoalloteichus hoggarensis]|uniref:Transcriptional regulator WhiB n=1 Tax=Actinoalloteichus hoggarensis TaxID=1470176 RepID=A0A221W569_9PSEU|nr:WhiB family transcriptional regulator [Actinoalloteichus hoggarensis]ASO21060.1 Transcriptional regulator WhiB1 [Actinoalloteichus hoggarensis]MBB5920991.1 WhiB family redox-sensing transcriptional regulator [Actinoalloteichus hoggarensis]
MTRDWRSKGECRKHDPEVFFPVSFRGVQNAKQICGRCPITEQCLTWALTTGEDHGIWGGTTSEERRALRRKKAA